MLFKLLDVLVAAAQLVPRLVGGFCCAASFKAHGAKRDDGTAIEWCAHCLASREIARRYAATIASHAALHKSQYWAQAPNIEVIHDATSTVDPAPDRAGAAIVSASPRVDTGTSLLDHYSTYSRHQSGPGPLMDQTTGAGPPSAALGEPGPGWHSQPARQAQAATGTDTGAG